MLRPFVTSDLLVCGRLAGVFPGLRRGKRPAVIALTPPTALSVDFRASPVPPAPPAKRRGPDSVPGTRVFAVCEETSEQTNENGAIKVPL
jgi:hypothetical protein